jgi:hypothetical protein
MNELGFNKKKETIAPSRWLENADSYAWAAARLWKATLSPAERAMFKVPI